MKSFSLIFGIVFTALTCSSQKHFHRLDSKFRFGSGLSQQYLTENNLSNIEFVGKIWGFLKYYHPAVRAGNYNWDFELFQLLALLRDKSKSQCDSLIIKWIRGLDRTNGVKQKISLRDDVKMNPDFNWFRNSGFSARMIKLLDSIHLIHRGGLNYYVKLHPAPSFNNEIGYSQYDFPDLGFRILSLLRYWNIIKYYYPYRYNLETRWDSVLHYELRKFACAENELQYKLAILSLITEINDSHARIVSGGDLLELYKGNRRLPVSLEIVSGKPVVSGYYDSSLGKSSGLAIGDIVESVNGVSVSQILEEKMPFLPASNEPVKLRSFVFDLLRTNDTVLTIGFIRNEFHCTISVKSIPNYLLDIYYKYHSVDTCCQIFSGNIGYINPYRLKANSIREVMKAFINLKGFIIDFRYALSEEIREMTDYLLENRVPFAKVTGPNNVVPGLFTFIETDSIGKAGKEKYSGNIILLVNEYTQSSGEYNVMAFKRYPKTIVIGSTTAGADGDVANIELPGGVTTTFSSLGIYYPDKSETQQIGIIPDIKVSPSIFGIREGKDEILDFAIRLLNKGKTEL